MRALTVLLWVLLLALPAHAQTQEPATLVADRVVFAQTAGILEASGNVEVFSDDRVLTARRITYNSNTDKITIEGPIQLREGDNLVILADEGELSGDFRDGILRGARMVFNRRLQLASVELSRFDGRYNRLYKTVTSSCRVCEGETPLWQIRAKIILHDQETRRIYFRDAQLRIRDVPVFYAPRLSVPEPGVKRASGFLPPSFINHTQRGVGVEIPFFIALSPYSDLKLTPIPTTRSLTLAAEFRRRFHNAGFDLSGAVSRDQYSGFGLRAFLTGSAYYNLWNGGTATLAFHQVSDSGYLGQYGFAGGPRRTVTLGYGRQTRLSYTDASYSRSVSLLAEPPGQTTPGVLTSFVQHRQLSGSPLGGMATLTFRGSSYNRSSTVNGALGRDGVRLGVALDWSRTAITGSGLVTETRLLARADVQSIGDDTEFPQPIARFAPVAGVTLRYPLIRHSAGGGFAVLEPVAQLVVASTGIGATPNEDSTFAELDDTNLFRLDRFAGVDQIERGARLNLGLTWSGERADGGTYAFSMGRVFRANNTGQFSTASGLSGTTSDYVFAARLAGTEGFNLQHRTVFDGRFTVSRNESRLGWSLNGHTLSATYLWKEADTTSGATAKRSEVAVDAGYNLSSNWNILANWRHDFATGLPTRGGINVVYTHDCMEMDFSVSRTFAASASVPSSTTVGARVILLGFGGNADSPSHARKCATNGG